MSQLIFWNKQNNNNNNNSKENGKENSKENGTNDSKNGKQRNWLHQPDSLVNGHVVYLVKFFGSLPVEQAKGIEVVKDAIRKLQFAQQMKKAETGTQEKFKKVEITISADGVAVQEPRTQKILHQFPLHNISYCADEKGIKKFFSFIAKTVTPIENNSNGILDSVSNAKTEETHECFVFISNKLASDITLTIGQAFDLAYKKYISTTEKSELCKAQQQIVDLEKTICIYKERLQELSTKVPKIELDNLLFKFGVKDIIEVLENELISNGNCLKVTSNDDKLLLDTNSNYSNKSSNLASTFMPIMPQRNNIPSQNTAKSNSQKMEELLLNSDSDSDFDPRADESNDSNGKIITNDLFGFEPPKTNGQQFFNHKDSKLPNNNLNNHNNNSNSNISFTNELNLTPPLLAPPPKANTTSRRTTSQFNSGNNIHLTNGTKSTDLFGSDPFDMNGPNIFQNKLNEISVDDFSLESLDPLRK